MKNKLLYILLSILILLLLILGPIIYKLYKEFYSYDYLKFDKPIYITTKNESNNKEQNYKLNNNRKLHKIKYNFTYDNHVYNLNGCYYFNNKISDDCEYLSSDDENIIHIIKLISQEEHSLMSPKIIKTKNNYYAIVPLNVNLWSPYEFYIYDRESKSLKLIHEFDGENVIAIKD